MKKLSMLRSSLILIVAALVVSCDKDNTEKDDNHEYGWSKTMSGNDPEEIAWPDQSENYWE